MTINPRVANRQLHRRGALLVALPFLVVVVTGILLQTKKQFAWIQPPEQRTANEVPGIPFAAILRMFTYKTALVFHLNPSMGDAVIAPLYAVLKRRGVKFDFFHRVERLGLSEGASSVASPPSTWEPPLSGSELSTLFLVRGYSSLPSPLHTDAYPSLCS